MRALLALAITAAALTTPQNNVEVTLKIALDRNGAVDDLGDKAERFTSPASLDAVHRLRRHCDAVLVGASTVARDDPSLTVRRVPLAPRTAQPLRVVLGRAPAERRRRLRLPGSPARPLARLVPHHRVPPETKKSNPYPESVK